jgi:ubiquinone/menaquinone biosynthesis C-methylase UbiE
MRNTTIFVDVGGGAGHQAINFKQKFPELPGRVIVQDLPYSIVMVGDESRATGVEYIIYNFFRSQPIKGGFNCHLSYLCELSKTHRY